MTPILALGTSIALVNFDGNRSVTFFSVLNLYQHSHCHVLNRVVFKMNIKCSKYRLREFCIFENPKTRSKYGLGLFGHLLL